MSERIGDWIQTYSGVQFWPLDPRVDEISLPDIAHALSNICRFTGHCKKFYSVAQHSFLVSCQVPTDDMKWALLHDATEAYLSDLSRPLKRFGAMGAEYKLVESRLMIVICNRFGLDYDEPPSVKLADDILLVTEKRDLMGSQPAKWRETAKPLIDLLIEPWPPETAERWFLDRAKELGIE